MTSFLHTWLPIAKVSVFAPGVVLLGFVSGFLSGFFGVGGGILLTPMLYIIFRVPYPVAISTSLAQMIPTAVSGTYRHFKLHNVDLRLAATIFCPGFGGILLGESVLTYLRSLRAVRLGSRDLPMIDLWMSLIFFALLVCIGWLMARESSKPGSSGGSTAANWVRTVRWPPLINFPHSGISGVSVWPNLALGFCVGMLAGLMGVGGGVIAVPTLIYAVGVPTRIAIGSSLFAIIFSAAFAAFAKAHDVDLMLVFFVVIGSFLGAQAGAGATERVKSARIRVYFGYICLLTAVATILNLALRAGLFA